MQCCYQDQTFQDQDHSFQDQDQKVQDQDQDQDCFRLSDVVHNRLFHWSELRSKLCHQSVSGKLEK